MSKLASENAVERLQLSFQDYGVPEILVATLGLCRRRRTWKKVPPYGASSGLSRFKAVWELPRLSGSAAMSCPSIR